MINNNYFFRDTTGDNERKISLVWISLLRMPSILWSNDTWRAESHKIAAQPLTSLWFPSTLTMIIRKYSTATYLKQSWTTNQYIIKDIKYTQREATL